MKDRDEKTGTDPEIEAHRRKPWLKASDELPKEGDDVEAHKKKATSEPGSDESDDVELHRKRTVK